MDIDQLTVALLASIANRNLAILSGAGISMSHPSNAPSAWRVADEAARIHREFTGEQLPADVDGDLEKVARHFYQQEKLSTYFVQRLVNWAPFRAVPNRAHLAVADFLACGAVDVAITTNYDEFVESAARQIGERDFRSALDGNEANQARPHQPYLKIYGCCVRDVGNTVWCVEQIADEPIATRLDQSSKFLKGRLLDRDLLVVGFWSDWNYLNSILEDALPDTANGHIFLVDPNSDEKLKEKAPGLWAWANVHQFTHIQSTADEVFDALRREFSRLLLHRVMTQASTTTPPKWLDGLDIEELFSIRRDLAGVDGVARDRDASKAMAAFARAHQEVVAGGATFEQGRFTFNGSRLRVVQAAGQMMSDVRAEFATRPALVDDLDAVICAGAEDDGGVSPNIVRGDATATIIRGGSRGVRFVTSAAALLNQETS